MKVYPPSTSHSSSSSSVHPLLLLVSLAPRPFFIHFLFLLLSSSFLFCLASVPPPFFFFFFFSSDREPSERERVNPRTAGFAWKRAPSPPIAPNLYPISRDTRVIGEISRRGSFWCALLNRSRWTQEGEEVRKEEGRTILGGMVGSREEGDEEKFIGGMKKCKDGGEGGKRWW